MRLWSKIKHDLWLIALSALAIFQVFEIQYWPDAWLSLVLYAPIVLAILGVFVSSYLNRLQPILFIITIALVNIAYLYYEPYAEATNLSLTANILLPLMAVLFPINWWLWSMLPEKGLQVKSYLLFVAVLILAQVFGVFWFMQNLALDWLNYLNYPVTHSEIHLTLASFVAFLLFWLVILFRNAYQQTQKVIDKVTIYGLVLMALAFNWQFEIGVLAWLSSFTLLFILLSLIFDSHQIAYTDELTGLQGRRALLESMQGLGKNYAIAMADVDHFKKFNDTYGHDIGDEVLKVVAYHLSQLSNGKVYRYGGEEFTLLFNNKSPEDIEAAIETLRQTIADDELEVPHNGKTTAVNMTVSFGLAYRSDEIKTTDSVLTAADDALYQAKKAGRNRLAVYGATEKKSKK